MGGQTRLARNFGTTHHFKRFFAAQNGPEKRSLVGENPFQDNIFPCKTIEKAHSRDSTDSRSPTNQPQPSNSRPQDSPKRTQDASKTQGRPKILRRESRRGQEWSRAAQERSKSGPRAPTSAQESEGQSKERGQKWPRAAQERSKSGPRAPKSGPNDVQTQES